MFKKHFIFLILPMAAAPVFTLCMRYSVGAPVSLSPPPEKAQSALIGQHASWNLRCTSVLVHQFKMELLQQHI